MKNHIKGENKMKIEVGKTYIGRSGHKVKIIRESKVNLWKFTDESGCAFSETGESYHSYSMDLIKECK